MVDFFRRWLTRVSGAPAGAAFALASAAARAQETGADPWDLAGGRPEAFYTGIALALALGALVALLWQARHQALHVAALERQTGELRAAEQRHELLLDKLRTHFENSPLVVVELDSARRFRQWTGRAESVFGWRAAEVMGQPCDALPWVDDGGADALQAAFAGAPGAPMTGRIVTVRHSARNGRRRQIEWHVSVLAGGPEAPESVLALGLDVTEREESAAQLRREQERYALAVQAGNAGLWSLDPVQGVVFWDEHLAGLLGYAPADFPGRVNQWLDLFHPDDRAKIEDALRACARNPGTRQNFESRLRHRDGDYRWFRLAFFIEPPALGEPMRVTGTATDLTRVKLAEEKFRGLVEQSLAGIFVLRDNRVEYANPKFWAIARSGGSRPPTRPDFLDLVHHDDRPMAEAQLRKLRSGEVREAPVLFRLAGPQGHAIAVQGHAIASEHEGHPAVLGLVMDVSHRFAQEQTTRRLSQVVEQSPVAILITNPDGLIEYANPKFCELSGYRQEELLGQTPRLLKSAEMPDEFFRELWERLNQGKKWEGEIVNRAKDGHQFTVRANLFPIFDETGAITHFVEIMEDITGQRALSERLARAQRIESLGNLAGGIAHDLNNILAPVRLGAEYLKTLPMAGKDREFVEVMDISIHRATELVQQVLAFSRGRSGKREVLAPGQIIRELERLVRETFPRDVRFELRVATDLGLVRVDGTQLLQILMNLCVNSRDAMPGGGVVTLAADTVKLTGAQTSSFPGARPGTHVRIRVADTGTGIPSEVRDKIFEPFFTTKDVGKGTGLGLSTALGIVQDHGGIIELESTGPQGTTFVLYLPVVTAAGAKPPGATPPIFPAAQTEVSAPAQPAAAVPQVQHTVLVVDDEHALRQAVALILSQKGFRVLEAADGLEAIQQVRERGGEIAAIVLDVMMPRLDGVGTMKALRELRPDLRVIATSGVNHDARVETLRQLGVRQFLLKPYRNHELFEALRACLDTNAT